jgi:N-acetylglutamate synthase-like GNAT family acetyltransferase
MGLMAGIRLREAEISDAGTIADLIRAAFEEYRGKLDPPSGAHAESANTISQKLVLAHAILAFIGDLAAGCVLYDIAKDYVYLFRLVVLPQYRLRGIGRSLIEHVEAKARSLNLPYVRLGERVALPRLRAYYDCMGYRYLESRTHPGYASPTYVILQKDIRSVNSAEVEHRA